MALLAILVALPFTPLRLKLPATLAPQVYLMDRADPLDGAANWARLNTPGTAMFLTPADAGRFRLVARRGIVIDFKSFVFVDEDMVQWYQRITDCYGKPRRLGFKASKEFDAHYRALTDGQLQELGDKYRASHAVLFAGTRTNLQVLYADADYQVVLLDRT